MKNAHVSMKLMPTKSFLINISPSLTSGTGKSVLYCRTSVPPFFSIMTAFIVLGTEAMVRANGDVRDKWEETAASLRVEVKIKGVVRENDIDQTRVEKVGQVAIEKFPLSICSSHYIIPAGIASPTVSNNS